MQNILEIYTDGSSLGNPGKGGFGVVITEGGKVLEEFGGHDKNTTNNRMELQAAISALRYIVKLENDVKAIVHTDSAYVLLGITSWIDNWEKNNWRTSNKKEVLNKDLWLELVSLKRKIGNSLSWEKVKGHSDDIYNNRADFIATSCAASQSNNF